MPKELLYRKKSYELLGGNKGIHSLTNDFYDIMENRPEAQEIRKMHPKNLDTTRENFAYFLSGWLGGPPLYKEKHGTINLTRIHSSLNIDIPQRDIWLSCMAQALERQDLEEGFRTYLLQRFQVPAEKIRETCQERQQGIPIYQFDTPFKAKKT